MAGTRCITVLRAACTVLVLVGGAPHARVTMAVFPLVNRDSTAAALSDWVSCAPAECFGRVCRYDPRARAWEPSFLFNADSTGWRLDSDSLAGIHQRQWGWDLALGGSYRTSHDSLYLSLRLARAVDGAIRLRRFSVAGVSVYALMEQIVVAVLDAAGEATLARELAGRVRGATDDERAYRTYVAGYCAEMYQRYVESVSAYLRALDLDPGLAFAAVRLGVRYDLSREPEKARTWMERAVDRAEDDPVVVGMAASFLARNTSPGVAAKLMEGRTRLLESTAAGLAAQGLFRMNRGSYDRAVAYLTKAVAYGAPDLTVDFDLGNAYLAKGNFDLAADVFNRLVTYRPDYAPYYAFLGSAYRRLGRHMESVRVLRVALRMHPEDVGLMVNLANTYVELGWMEEAERLLLKARHLNPALAEIDVNLAVVYWHQGRDEEAEEISRRLRKQSTHTAAVLSNQAGMLRLAGERKAALTRLERAQAASPANEEVLYNLALVSTEMGRLRDAEMWYNKLLAISPRRLDVLKRAAEISLKRGDLAAAEKRLETVLDISPHNEDAVSMLAMARVRLGQEQKAADVLQRYLNDFPGDIAVRVTLGDIYFEMEYYQVAEMHYREALKDMPDSYRANLGLGKSLYGMSVHKRKNRGSEAETSLKKALVLSADNAEAEYYLGCVYLDALNNRPLAQEHLVRAQAKADRELKGRIRAALGRIGQ